MEVDAYVGVGNEWLKTTRTPPKVTEAKIISLKFRPVCCVSIFFSSC